MTIECYFQSVVKIMQVFQVKTFRVRVLLKIFRNTTYCTKIEFRNFTNRKTVNDIIPRMYNISDHMMKKTTT